MSFRVLFLLALLGPLCQTTIAQDQSGEGSVKQGPLRSALTIIDVEVDSPIATGSGYDNPSSFWNGQSLRPIIYAQQPNGGAKIGWTDTSGKVHITPIDSAGKRTEADQVLTGLLRDLVAHDDGFAVLMLQNGGMYLERFHNRQSVFKTRLISNSSRAIHMGSLAYNGQKYGAYFAIHGGGHEGDALRYVDTSGKILSGGWGWGCSHCIDMRLARVDEQFVPLGLSDAYPGTGFYYHHNRKRVAYTWGDRSGATGGRIGGLASINGRMYLAFSTREGGRRHWGAALADFSLAAPYSQKFNKFITADRVDQYNVKIARYGNDQLLLSWLEKEGWQRKFQVCDAEGQVVGNMEVLPVRASPRADMKTLPSGDVVWAHTWGEDKNVLKVMRIQAAK